MTASSDAFLPRFFSLVALYGQAENIRRSSLRRRLRPPKARNRPVRDFLSIEMDNDIAEIARVVACVERFCERHHLPECVAYHLKLAFDELLTNIILHGFIDGGSHRIKASLELEGDRLVAELVDDGIAFDPLAQAAPKLDPALEDRAVGGLGIHFVRSMMDQMNYRRANGCNHLLMVKKLPKGRQGKAQPHGS